MKIEKIHNPKWDKDTDERYVCDDCDYIITSEPVYIFTIGFDYISILKNKEPRKEIKFTLCERDFKRFQLQMTDAFMEEDIENPEFSKKNRYLLAEAQYKKMEPENRKDFVVKSLVIGYRECEAEFLQEWKREFAK